MTKILEARNLYMYYRTRWGPVKAVDGVSFTMNKGETLALVGESGCGKSSIADSIFRILPRNVGIYEGEVYVNGEDVMKLSEEEFRRKIRWQKIAMVFQGAQNSLNPVLKIGLQVAEPLIIHKGMSKEEALERAKEALKMVGIHPSFADRYPHELSGGMKQRAVIAMALISNPEIVILDEPTSALDIITQASIMNLLKKLKYELNLTYLLITHDIAVSSELADRIIIMYAGHIVEELPAKVFYTSPSHPYSQGLLRSVPTLRSDKEVVGISGTHPDLINIPPGCRFHPRCQYAMSICREKTPDIIKLSEDHEVRCWLFE